VKIETRNIDAIKPYPGNPRQNDEAVDAVAASLQEFGFRQPIVVDAEGVIIVGHTRWRAAKKIGLTEVPVHVADLTATQAKAYRIADNATAQRSDWDYTLLGAEVADLKSLDFPIDLLGFDDQEMARILGNVEPPASLEITDESWAVIVECKDEPDQVAFLEQMEREGRTCKAVVA
jgi:site-specific DNA-methyltransferase (adenine-specific)